MIGLIMGIAFLFSSLLAFGAIGLLVEADKEGRLIVPPCKIGDIVWSAHELIGLNRHQIRRIERNNEGDPACSALMFGFEEFGKKFFLSPKEAEAALEGMKEGNNQ